MRAVVLLAIAAMIAILLFVRRWCALVDENRPRCFGDQRCGAEREEISCINCEYAFECLKETRERWSRE